MQWYETIYTEHRATLFVASQNIKVSQALINLELAHTSARNHTASELLSDAIEAFVLCTCPFDTVIKPTCPIHGDR
jgi:hypothetical protein